MKYCKKCGKQLMDGQICDCVVGGTMPTQAQMTPRPAPYRPAPPPAPSRQTQNMPSTAQTYQTPQTPPPATPRQTPHMPLTAQTYQTSQTPPPAAPHTAHPRASTYQTPHTPPPATPQSASNTTKLRFFESIMIKLGMGDLYRKFTAYYERGKMIVPDCIAPNEGEIPVKQYDIAVLRSLSRFERSEGRLQITNKRLIFRATGRSISGSTSFQQEFAIDELAGVEALRNYRFGLIYLVADLFMIMMMLLVVLAVCACIAIPIIIPNAIINVVYNSSDQNTPLKYQQAVFYYENLPPEIQAQREYPLYESFRPNQTLFSALRIIFSLVGLAVSIIVLVSLLKMRNKFLLIQVKRFLMKLLLKIIRIARRPNMVFMVKTKGGIEGGTPIKIKRDQYFLFIRLGTENGYSEVFPTSDTDIALKEIGAIINDIQKLGDHGVHKWKV